MTDSRTPFLTVKDVVKNFDGVLALDGVSLSVYPGEVLCLAGENGCGKSTLIKVISGVHKPDSGTIEINGDTMDGISPLAAMKAGIQVIYQDFSLFPNLTVAENIALTGAISQRQALYRRKESTSLAREVVERLGVKLPLDVDVEKLSVADKQLTAICRALANDARLLIMDEPTTALTHHEVERLFAVVEKLRAEGVALVFVSHKLDEVMRISQRVAIMRSGRNVLDAPASELDRESIAVHMTGKQLDQTRRVPELQPEAPVMLRVTGLNAGTALKDVNFSVQAGEIVGLTGLLGSGRSEIAEALFGLLPKDSGTIEVHGKVVNIRGITDAIAAGIGYVPEDRLTEGLFLDQSIAHNVVAASIDQHTSKMHTLRTGKIKVTIGRYFSELRIKAPDVQAAVRTLSGGNAQRVVLAKWLARNPKILILNGPTVGVDVGSKAEILDILREQARQGMSVIVISDDAPELVSCCHRVLVTRNGRIEAELAGDQMEADTIRELVVA
ncbi:sugar ABC transporter ATP-binding protein [Schaalia sp. ZJ405]|uniref:sugar ABC transporter ATP-binding protein n=1 Tax=Schaalia sp. ZJ405 TaxID=2709403 RepID=UPI0013ECF343|nr:sugar ABC transporter ATP-binding protein [Schaalia sp. ZJ405]QPK80899.1 sugar ABC transporter ATP-binding protein [Schaalia sp. ZJ405]